MPWPWKRVSVTAWFSPENLQKIFARRGVRQQSTINLKLIHAKTFLKFAESENLKRLHKLEEKHIWDFVTSMRDKGFRPSTQHSYVGTVRNALKVAIAEGLIKADPTAEVWPLKGVEKRLPRTFSEVQLYRLFRGVTGELLEMLTVLFEQGLRAGELRHLRFEDVDEIGDILHIREHPAAPGQIPWRPKNKTATIPLFSHTKRIVLERFHRNGNGSRYVFPNRQGLVWNKLTLRNRLQKACRELGIDFGDGRPPTFNDFRHTRVSQWLQSPDVTESEAADLARDNPVTIRLYYQNIDQQKAAAKVRAADQANLGFLAQGELFQQQK